METKLPLLYHSIFVTVESGREVIIESLEQIPLLLTETIGKGFIVNVSGES